MLRVLTAGESHGPELVAIMEGLPAGVPISRAAIQADLARRKLGYGRGSRMKFEEDELTISRGVRHGDAPRQPHRLRIGNTEWPKWVEVMSPDPVELTEKSRGRGAALTRPRPGHADLVGMQKYGFDEARPILERASARETAARVALGALARAFLAELGIRLVSHTLSIGPVRVPEDAALPDARRRRRARRRSAALLRRRRRAPRMVDEVDAARKDGDTLGGIVEVLAYGLPPGLGSHVHWDRRLDGKLAQALMSIQAIKGVEVGDGFLTTTPPRLAGARRALRDATAASPARSDKAGGTEGGMSTGTVLRVRAGMKPIATVPHALRTVDVATGDTAAAHHQRSDVCAVPAAGVVAEAMVAIVLAEVVLEKFGGDSVAETRRNLESYLAAIPETLRSASASDAALADMTSRSDAVVLIGPMGAGKTSIGRRVAKALGVPFFDTDIAVVARARTDRAALRRARRSALPRARARRRARRARDRRRRLARRRRGARSRHPRRPRRAPRRAAHRRAARSSRAACASRAARCCRATTPIARWSADLRAAPADLRRARRRHVRHVDTARCSVVVDAIVA